MNDARESLREELCMLLMNHDIPNASIEVDMLLGKYEIQERCTEIALVQTDRNKYLLGHFFIAKTVKGCTPRTLDTYRKTLTFIFDKIGKTIDDITTDDIRYYLAKRQKIDKIEAISADNERRALYTFYEQMTLDELLPKNPVKKIDRIKGKSVKKKAFTDLEIEKLRDAVRCWRERAIIETLLSTGCRVSEAVNIKISDIDENKILVTGKGNKERIVYLNAKAQNAIEKYLAERTDMNPYLFCGGYGLRKGKMQKVCSEKDIQYYEWYKEPELVTLDTHTDIHTIQENLSDLKKRAGLKVACNPHKFRRTFATKALGRGMPIEQVSKMLGHNDLTTTQIYLDLSEEELEHSHRKYVV